MKKISIICLLTILSLQCVAQSRLNSKYQAYIEQYKDIAIKEMLKYNIPASITLAQGLLESAAGQSELARRGNNHFGIKCRGWSGATIYHDDDEANECFRAYNSASDSYEDHSHFLVNSQRYKRLFSLKHTDYKGWANGLKACGYATNPQYGDRLIGLIQLYKLYEFDNKTSYNNFMVKQNRKGQQYNNGAPLHPIHVYNKNYYLIARTGDTFRSIGKEVDLSYRKIASNNERDKNDILQEGDIIYLKKKRNRAVATFKKRLHVVKANESMYDISQKYGIKLKSLYKKNNLSFDYNVKVGDKLKVY